MPAVINFDWGELRKVIALVCMNIIAFIYDQNWIMYVLGIDAVILGFEIKERVKNRGGKRG